MLIGELAARTGVPAKTIRHWEAVGVIPPPARTPAGYRSYDEAAADRVRFVRRAQALGLRLDEIAEILALRDRGQRPCRYVREVAAARLGEIDRRISELRRARDELAALLEDAETVGDAGPAGDPGEMCPLIEHRRPAR